MSVFGVLSNRGQGHVVTTILIAMMGMLLTAFSYGRMARVYPSAGSAFTFVGQEINPVLGYVTGWSMVMDYMLNPMICIIWCSQQAHVFATLVIALAGAFLMSYGLRAEMLNFGALIAFMGVNAAAVVHYYIRQNEKRLVNVLPPVAGFLICFALWLGLSRPAQIAGAIWMALGIAFGAWKTHGFRSSLINFELPEE